MTDRIARRGARVVVLDDDDCVLLLRGFDPSDEAPPWWFTPGGGVDEGESELAAAQRELFEETGFRAASLVGPIWYRTTDFAFLGEKFRQSEVFYLLRTERFAPTTTHWTDVERDTMLGFRWWDLTELERSGETFYPGSLVQHVRDLLQNGVAAEPIDVGAD